MPSSLKVRSGLKYFPAHQPVAKNSMHLQSTYTLHLQHLCNQRRILHPVKHLQWNFLAEIVDFFRLLIIFAEERLAVLQDSGCDFVQ